MSEKDSCLFLFEGDYLQYEIGPVARPSQVALTELGRTVDRLDNRAPLPGLITGKEIL